MSTQPQHARQAVGELAPNQNVSEVYLLSSCQVRTARNDSLYIQATLTDQTGSIECRVWSASEAMVQALAGARFVFIKGRTEVYQDRLQVVAAGIRPVSAEKVVLDDFLPHTTQDVDDLWRRLVEGTKTIADVHLSQLVRAFLDDEKFARDFKRCPAAVSYHQPYLGGLLEHTVNMFDFACFICERYTSLNRDLLLAGVVLHDIGKIRELTYDGPFDYTDRGKLVGHVVLGAMMVRQKVQDIPDFPDDLRDAVLHMILSHHGEYEWGSPKLPMIPEAFALHHLDNLDAKVEGSARAIRTDQVSTGSWTGWNPMFKRQLYKGPSQEDGSDG